MNSPSDDDIEVARVEAILAARLGVSGPAPATRIGRYAVLDRIGAGAMGVVYRAFDDRLERPIAIKLVHAELDSPSLRERLHREARSMAKLSSAHVASVFEFGDHAGRSFVAMELVRGQSMRRWQHDTQRPWPEVVAAYLQAARGLAAAHVAGVIHRDFKPDNAVIDEHGLVKVLDFGLARTSTLDDTPTLETIEALPTDDSIAPTPMTRRGSLIGTPAYMAPELLEGGDADARSDQFALCVSLYEALHGTRPFTGRTAGEIAKAIAGGVPELPSTVAPRWLQRILKRGLDPDPTRRFATTTMLVTALERGQARARWRMAGVGAAALAIAAVAFAGGERWLEARARAACRDEGALAIRGWDDAARERIAAALRESGVGYAETTIERVEPWIDRQVAALQQAREDACIAVAVDETWDTPTFDAATWCLDERRVQLDLLLAELALPGAAGLTDAVTSAARLAPVDPCIDVDALRRTPAVPPELRDELAALREDDAHARALGAAADYEGASTLAAALNDRADALGWPSSIADTRLTAAWLASRRDDHEAAETLAMAAYFAAARASDWQRAAVAATRLIRTVGFDRVRPDDAEIWNRHAEVALALADDPGELLEANRLDALATSLSGAGRNAEARDTHARALAIREATLGTEHPGLAHSLGLVAAELGELGEDAAALAMFERELAIEIETIGADHPDAGMTRMNMGVTTRNMGDYEASRSHLEAALTILEPALGPNNTTVALCLTNLGIAHRALGDYPAARALQERAVAIAEIAYGPDHPMLASILGNLAGVHDGLGEHAAAIALDERAVAVLERAVGPDHPHLASQLDNLAMNLVDGDEPERGRALHARALAIFEKAFGPNHPRTALAMLGIARADRRLGRQADAIAPAERALAIQERAGIGAEWIADTQFMLARILWEAPVDRGRDRDRAAQLARQARDTYRAMVGQAKELALTETWLREQALD